MVCGFELLKEGFNDIFMRLDTKGWKVCLVLLESYSLLVYKTDPRVDPEHILRCDPNSSEDGVQKFTFHICGLVGC